MTGESRAPQLYSRLRSRPQSAAAAGAALVFRARLQSWLRAAAARRQHTTGPLVQ